MHRVYVQEEKLIEDMLAACKDAELHSTKPRIECRRFTLHHGILLAAQNAPCIQSHGAESTSLCLTSLALLSTPIFIELHGAGSRPLSSLIPGIYIVEDITLGDIVYCLPERKVIAGEQRFHYIAELSLEYTGLVEYALLVNELAPRLPNCLDTNIVARSLLLPSPGGTAPRAATILPIIIMNLGGRIRFYALEPDGESYNPVEINIVQSLESLEAGTTRYLLGVAWLLYHPESDSYSYQPITLAGYYSPCSLTYPLAILTLAAKLHRESLKNTESILNTATRLIGRRERSRNIRRITELVVALDKIIARGRIDLEVELESIAERVYTLLEKLGVGKCETHDILEVVKAALNEVSHCSIEEKDEHKVTLRCINTRLRYLRLLSKTLLEQASRNTGDTKRLDTLADNIYAALRDTLRLTKQIGIDNA